MNTPEPNATAPELAQAHRHLTIAFALNLVLNIASYGATQMGIAPDMLMIMTIASLAASIYLCIALYSAARKIGFSMVIAILSIILSFFIPLLGLVLIVSADIRLSKQLRSKSWKVGLLGANPV